MFIERYKIRSKGLVQGPGVQKTFRLSNHTPEQFNVMPRTCDSDCDSFNSKVMEMFIKKKERRMHFNYKGKK